MKTRAAAHEGEGKLIEMNQSGRSRKIATVNFIVFD